MTTPDPQETPLVRNDAQASSAGPSQRLHRRRLIGAGAAGAVGVATAAASIPIALAQQSATPTAAEASHAQPAGPVGYTTLSPFQAKVLTAAVGRLIPTDELGPGADQTGVVFFIDRQLVNKGNGLRGVAYRQGPFTPGAPTQGDQSFSTVEEQFRIGILGLESLAQQLHGAGFADLTPEQQDAILADLEQGKPETFGGDELTSPPTQGVVPPAVDPAITPKAFFELLLGYTQAGYFADPIYLGNTDMASWRLIGFPGAHMDYAEHILEYGVPYTGPYMSLAQTQGFGGKEHAE